jgi:hypothetical protein
VTSPAHRSTPTSPRRPPPYDPHALARVVPRVEIAALELIGAYFRRRDDGLDAVAVSQDMAPDFGISVEWGRPEPHVVACLLTFGTAFEGDEPYELIGRFRATYTLEAGPDLDDDDLEQFAHWNAVFNAWPYWREYVASTLSRAHLPPLTVPVMRVPSGLVRQPPPEQERRKQIVLHHRRRDTAPRRSTKRDIRQRVHWNLWSRQRWPLKELKDGDELLLVETWPRGSLITWHLRVRDVVKARYDSLDEVVDLLAETFRVPREEVREDEYTQQAPPAGWCLAWRYTPVRLLHVERPEGLKFPRTGWLRFDELDEDVRAAVEEALGASNDVS